MKTRSQTAAEKRKRLDLDEFEPEVQPKKVKTAKKKVAPKKKQKKKIVEIVEQAITSIQPEVEEPATPKPIQYEYFLPTIDGLPEPLFDQSKNEVRSTIFS